MELAGPFDLHLLRGCCVEADRSDLVWFQLEGLRTALNMNEPHLTAVIEEIRTGSRALRELADLSQVYRDRLPLILNPLNIILPCLSRSLRDITAHYENRAKSKSNRWRSMYHTMTTEAGGLSLPGRFMAYNQYLSCLRDLLVRYGRVRAAFVGRLLMLMLELGHQASTSTCWRNFVARSCS